MKKLGSLILASALFLLFAFQTVSFAMFDDVSPSHDNFDAIEYVQSESIVKGYDDGTYKPDQTINRAEFTKIIVEATRSGDISGENCFPDVSDEWFAKYVCKAKADGIIQGYPDGNFKPGQNISFVEAAKIIVVSFGYTTEPDDVWYKPFVDSLADKEAIPTSIDAFTKNITRGEMAEMIYRLKANVINKSSLTYNELAGIIEEELPAPGPTEPGEEINVKVFVITAKRFDFTPDTITVKEGDTVRLEITSTDVTHGITIARFGVNEVIDPGETTVVEFVADQKGEFSFFCSVVCGSGHGQMKGKIIVE